MIRVERIADCRARLEALHEAQDVLRMFGDYKQMGIVASEVLAVVTELRNLRVDQERRA